MLRKTKKVKMKANHKNHIKIAISRLNKKVVVDLKNTYLGNIISKFMLVELYRFFMKQLEPNMKIIRWILMLQYPMKYMIRGLIWHQQGIIT